MAGREEETGLLAEKFGAPLNNSGIFFFSIQFIVNFLHFFCPSPSSLLVYLCLYLPSSEVEYYIALCISYRMFR
jgi:hypothetical protein